MRRFVVSINPTERDLASLVTRLEQEVADRVSVSDGYRISFEGEFKAQQEASKRIAMLTGIVFVVIAFLLYTYFKTPVFALQVICDVPLALIGGLAFTWMMINNISIATLVDA